MNLSMTCRKSTGAAIKKRLPILVIILVTFGELSFSQGSDYIRGKILSSETSEPVSFATVMLKANQVGLYANAGGDFSVPEDSRFRDDSLIITSIGFRRHSIAFRSLKHGVINRIMINPAVYTLDEVKILSTRKKLRPEEIIHRAIRNINKNYQQQPFSYVAYYRDYLKKEESYYNLNEAIVQAWDIGFKRRSIFNDYSMMDLVRNTDFPRIPVFVNYDNAIKYIPGAILPDQGGNELLILMVHDAIRNHQTATFSFVNTFAYDFVKNHEFSDYMPVLDNNRLLYKISFTARKGLTNDSIFLKGDIYIHPRTYAIYKLDYSAFYKTKTDETKRMFSITTEYGLEHSPDDKLRLKYISFNNTFSLVDTSGNSYFRLISCFRDDPLDFTRFFFEFNNKVDRISASKPECYKIMFGDHQAAIKAISIGDNRVMVRVEYGLESKGKILAEVKGVKDIDGRILDVKKTVNYYQYRELFVQEYVDSSSSSGRCLLLNKPLDQNCLTPYTGAKKYWMNTPLKSEKQ